ncbi:MULTISPECIES: antA/AntB antirepressor family protein [unclassified Paraburkholderia]|uniref:antA/AntB antirepressor family protein n=1 Tax=unclassified Paraburkholderia TaxID=2615204 RepID=UPI00162210D2|nr:MULTISPECIES: antA/AntB antirepressor family protein [unclassified Paraburkholderia]MBB5444667.1 phage anti-repressor protein [Paraburkholderia sp. WSM4177]MBB5485492.1 phage anti-repressor protein [Paraburkholderia sp. WSM4180]
MSHISTSIPVFTGESSTAAYVDARALWSFLGVGRHFAPWVTSRIAEYGFVEGEDYFVAQNRGEKGFCPNSGKTPAGGFSKNGEKPLGGRPSKEYSLTLGMAKELSMVERTEQGRIARRYFIACERRLMKIAPAEPAAAMREVISRSQFGDLRRDIHEIARLVKGRTHRSACHSLYKGLHEKLGVATCAEIAVDQLDVARDWLADRRDEWQVIDTDRAMYTLDHFEDMMHDWYLGGRVPSRTEVEVARKLLVHTMTSIAEAKLQFGLVAATDRPGRVSLRNAKKLLARAALAVAIPREYRGLTAQLEARA